MVDANHAYDAIAAIRLGRAIEELDIGWFEEPVPPEDIAGYREVKAALDDPGRRRRGRVHPLGLPPAPAPSGSSTSCSPTSAPPAASRSARRSPTWPRPSACGSSRMSGAPGSRLPPRCSCSPCCRTTRRALHPIEPLLEFDRSEHPIREAVTTEPIVQHGGWVRVPAGPGLGIEIDRAALERFRA